MVERHLRAGPLPRPRDRVQLIGIAYAHGLDGHARVEGARFERNQTGPVRARAFREDQYLGPVQVGSRSTDDFLDGILARIGVVAPDVHRLREVDQL